MASVIPQPPQLDPQGYSVFVLISRPAGSFLLDITLKIPVVGVNSEIVSWGRCPVFTPLSEVSNELLSACFLLRLQPAVSMMSSFVERFRSITGKGKTSTFPLSLSDHHLSGSSPVIFRSCDSTCCRPAVGTITQASDERFTEAKPLGDIR